jgi:hypothetical protein
MPSRSTRPGARSFGSPSSSRGGGSRGGGGGGSTNAVATVVGVVVVGAIVGAVFLMGGKKTPPPKALPTATVQEPPKPAAPTGPAPKPYPTMPAAKATEAASLVQSFEGDGARAQTLYTESQKAKKDGDDALWQKKLHEAVNIASAINGKWNDFIATLPASKDYDEEEVAKHYFSKESGRVTQLTGAILKAAKTDLK